MLIKSLLRIIGQETCFDNKEQKAQGILKVFKSKIKIANYNAKNKLAFKSLFIFIMEYNYSEF